MQIKINNNGGSIQEKSPNTYFNDPGALGTLEIGIKVLPFVVKFSELSTTGCMEYDLVIRSFTLLFPNSMSCGCALILRTLVVFESLEDARKEID